MRGKIEKAVKEALNELGAKEIDFVVERPRDMAHGDYATNAALVASKALKTSPLEVAKKIKKLLKVPGVQKIEVVGGFVNFTLSFKEMRQEVLDATLDNWGKNDLYKNKKIMVEYTDPNPFKEFHIGHLMSNAIGESIARLFEFGGAKVVRANYQGDVGPHVAKAMYILVRDGINNPTIADISSAYVQGAKEYEENVHTKIKIDNINRLIYSQYEQVTDEALFSLYKKGKEISLQHFQDIYKTLGTKFDRYFFESETSRLGKEIVLSHKEVFKKSEGAWVFEGDKHGLHTRVFVTKFGIPTYEAKDLGLLQLKQETEQVDLSVTVTANEQSEYFKVVLKAAESIEKIKDFAKKTKHVSHGLMRLAEGKMSSRKGNVITGESLVNEMINKSSERFASREDLRRAQIETRHVLEVLRQKFFRVVSGKAIINASLKSNNKFKGNPKVYSNSLKQKVAVGAIKYAILKQASGKDIIFDTEKSLSIEGDSGPYLQYAYARALSLSRKASIAKLVSHKEVESDEDFEEFASMIRVMRVLIHFPHVLERASKELEPHYVANYLTELASAFNSWYGTQRIISDGTVGEGVPQLIKATENTLSIGLEVLGIPTPEEM